MSQRFQSTESISTAARTDVSRRTVPELYHQDSVSFCCWRAGASEILLFPVSLAVQRDDGVSVLGLRMLAVISRGRSELQLWSAY